MPVVQLRAAREEDATCLVSELAAYAPRRVRDGILIEIDERSTVDLLALLSAIETCVAANDIRSVRIELDGQKYTLAPR
jgi:hypothetical protein